MADSINTSLPDSRPLNQLATAVTKTVDRLTDKFNAQFLGEQTVAENINEGSSAKNMLKQPASNEFDVVDVVADYDWTLSQNKAVLRGQIPFIRLTEFKITASNVINSLQSTLMAFSDIAAANNQVLNALPDIGSKILGPIGALGGAALESISPQLQNDISEITKDLKNTVDGKLGAFLGAKSSVQSITTNLGNSITNYVRSTGVDSPRFGEGSGNLIDLYGGLYTRKATGREYTLPYFTDDYVSISNGFEDSYGGFAGGIGKKLDNLVDITTTPPSLTEPGVYVQRPKFYNFKTEGTSISFTFNLFNTITPMAHRKNNELIQKLALNNMPRRFSRVVVEPPCIYEVMIPGKAFYPYCFIEKLEIKHMGTKRVIGREIIPEAYQVVMTLRSLTTDVSNFYDTQMTRHGMTFSSASDASQRTGVARAGEPSNGSTPPEGDRPVVRAEAVQREAVSNQSQTLPAEMMTVDTATGQVSQPSAATANVPGSPITPAQISGRNFTSYNIPGWGGF